MSERSPLDVFSKGRVISERQRQAHVMGRRRYREAPSPEPGHHEAVVKVIGWGKSARAANMTAAYITRTRKSDGEQGRITAIADNGRPIPPDQLKERLESWGLIPDHKNLSHEALALPTGERNKLPERTRFAKRQTGHMILSVPAKVAASPEQVRQVAEATLDETLDKGGVRYLFVIHTDHSARPHAHVLFSARTDEGAQVRMGREDLRVIREVFAEKARDAGIPLKATARADRRPLVQEIEAGRAKVRASDSYVVAKRGLSTADKENWLPSQAPLFAARHGAAYQQRRAGQPETAPRPAPIEFRPLHPKAANALEAMFRAYDDGKGAQQRFLELFAEKPKFAIWAVNNRPDLFGKVSDPSKPPALSQKVAQIPKGWRDDAALRLAGALPPAPAVATATRHIAERARQQAEAGRTERQIAAVRVQFARTAERFGPLSSPTTGPRPTRVAPAPAVAAPAERKRPNWWQRIIGKGQGAAPGQSTAEVPKQTPASVLIGSTTPAEPKHAGKPSATITTPKTPPRDPDFRPITRGRPRTRG